MSADPLRDDLGIELERLMAIAPSPELSARVRERVAAERVAAWGTLRWQFVGAAATAAVIAISVLGLPSESTTPPLPVIPPSNAPAISVPVLPLDIALTLSIRPRADDAVRKERAAPQFPSLAMPQLEPLTQISIEPLAIEPLGTIAPLSGDPQ